MKLTCQAPAKIILSGEHSVVYGAPSLSLAIDLPTECNIAFSSNKTAIVAIELVNYQQKYTFDFKAWQKLALNIDARFQLYLQKVSSIQTVLHDPIDLILVILQQFHQTHGLKQGHWSIKIKSHHLPNRGLGSSAAVILSLLSGLYKAHNLVVQQELILALAQTIESRQHGKSSGIDPATILLGGLLRYQHHKQTIKSKTNCFQAWLIDTGAPKDSTGKSVEVVAKAFNANHAIWSKFKKVTYKMELAYKQKNSIKLCSAIRANQNLLEKIGVIPEKVSRFIKDIHQDANVAAKVCGAGSISGDAAGMVLYVSPNIPKKLCQEYGYEVFPLVLQQNGVRCELDN